MREVQNSIHEISLRSATYLSTLQKKGETLFDSIAVFENYPGNSGKNLLHIKREYEVDKN